MAAASTTCDGDGKHKGKNGDDDVEEVAPPSLVSAVAKLSLSASSSSSGSTAPPRRKKLLILDVNGLLAHTFFPDLSDVKIPASRRPDAVVGRKYVFKRPFCDEFLRFCFDNFDVAVWCTATRRNAAGAVECVMGSFSDRLLFVWDQAQCTDTGFKTPEKGDKPLFVKQLSKVWDASGLAGGIPRSRGRRQFSAADTLLVDDSPYKALLNPPNTAIFPLPYKVDVNIDDASLGPKGELRGFLEGLARADVDVPSYVGSHSLGQQPITEAHPQWSFYSRVVDRFHSPRPKAVVELGSSH